MRAEAISKSSLTCFQQHSRPPVLLQLRVWSYWSWSRATLGLWKHKHLRTGTGWCSLGARTGERLGLSGMSRGSQTRRNIPSLIKSGISQPPAPNPPEFILPRTTWNGPSSQVASCWERSVLVVYRLLPAVMRPHAPHPAGMWLVGFHPPHQAGCGPRQPAGIPQQIARGELLRLPGSGLSLAPTPPPLSSHVPHSCFFLHMPVLLPQMSSHFPAWEITVSLRFHLSPGPS